MSATDKALLDELPSGSVVLDHAGQAWQKVRDERWHGALWKDGASSQNMAANLGPFTVIHRKEP